MTYINQSMSLRAFEAFESGEAPLSDWKKESIKAQPIFLEKF